MAVAYSKTSNWNNYLNNYVEVVNVLLKYFVKAVCSNRVVQLILVFNSMGIEQLWTLLFKLVHVIKVLIFSVFTEIQLLFLYLTSFLSKLPVWVEVKLCILIAHKDDLTNGAILDAMFEFHIYYEYTEYKFSLSYLLCVGFEFLPYTTKFS